MHPLTKLRPSENIYDYSKYKYTDFQYRIVRDTDTEKWGNIDVILSEYVEGKENQIKSNIYIKKNTIFVISLNRCWL